MNSSISLSAFGSPLPLLKGERIEVRGSKIERELKLQTLTLPSLSKGRRIKAQMQVSGVKPDP